MTRETKNLIYVITCHGRNEYYIGELNQHNTQSQNTCPNK